MSSTEAADIIDWVCNNICLFEDDEQLEVRLSLFNLAKDFRPLYLKYKKIYKG